jgi:glycosyltransferase involved in cell wall biosynthesis
MLHHLLRSGHCIHFVYTGCEAIDHDRAIELMRHDWTTVDYYPTTLPSPPAIDTDYALDAWINPVLFTDIPSLVSCYNIHHALVEYVFHSAYFNALPSNVTRILDTHDRLSRRALFTSLGLTPGFFYTSVDDERHGLARADIILAIQDNEVSYFADAGPPVLVIGHIAPPAFVNRTYPHLETLGYIGARNKFNEYSLRAFLPAFSDYAAASTTSITLRVAGNICNAFNEPAFRSLPHIDFVGYVDSPASFYDSIDLVINPTLVGTGLKIKSLEAISYGVPVLSTDIGWDGLPPLPAHHDCTDIASLLSALSYVQAHATDALTQLANYSKSIFSEYIINSTETLHTLFSLPRNDAIKWAADNPRYVGNRQSDNPYFVPLTAPVAHRLSVRDIRLAHVVNPVLMPKTSDLYIAQPIAFTSLARARDASTTQNVTLVSCAFEHDSAFMRPLFDVHHVLTRSSRDLIASEKPRTLPFIADIFNTHVIPDDATHVIYTNSDICVQPSFYDFVTQQLRDGYDALVINRRTISKSFFDHRALPDMYKEYGDEHPGFDCFVVSREVLEKCHFGEALIGVHLIGRIIFWNILSYARRIKYLPAAHLTFHIGNDVPSKSRTMWPYIKHNLLVGRSVIERLQADPGYFYLDDRAEIFSNVLRVSPGTIRGTFNAATDPKNSILMHSFFRTGSTYVFEKIRHSARWTAYYEPFHEELAQISQDRLDEFKERHAPDKFRHDANAQKDEWFFAEYEQFLDPGVNGVRYFDRRMSYQFAFADSQDAIRRYINALINSAQTENVFLQFNRTAPRIRLLKELFPESVHLYINRNVRDIWGSYISFERNGVYGFMRNHLAMALFNNEHPIFRALAARIPLLSMDYTFYFHDKIANAMKFYTLEEHYLLHVTLHEFARREALDVCDYTIDLERAANDRLYQLEMEAVFASIHADISFSDVKYRSYKGRELLLGESTLSSIEEEARDIVDGVRTQSVDTLQPSILDKRRANIGEYICAANSERIVHIEERVKRIHRDLPAKIPPLAYGRKYSITDLEKNGVQFTGFHDRDRAGHVWINGSVGILGFVIENVKDAIIHIVLNAHPTMVDRGEETHILINGGLKRSVRLSKEWATISLNIGSDCDRGMDGMRFVGITSDRYFRGNQRDPRHLSIGIKELWLERA